MNRAGVDRDGAYHHSRLRSPSDIRILYLCPSSRGEELQGKLKAHSANDLQDHGGRHGYDALSYCWSAREPPHYITLEGGKRLRITENCAQALLHLRRERRKRRLWVDSICLDQSEDDDAIEERNHQVLNMEKIYTNARQVLVWLGTADKDTEQAFSQVSMIGSFAGGKYTSTLNPSFRGFAKSVLLANRASRILSISDKAERSAKEEGNRLVKQLGALSTVAVMAHGSKRIAGDRRPRWNAKVNWNCTYFPPLSYPPSNII
jgi:Heterokaryon incompatibility protein (HET)